MHVISHRRIVEAADAHPDCRAALDHWYRIAKHARIDSFAQLRTLFAGVDKVGARYVFNIGGNKLRLIAAVHFDRQKIYVREILTHSQYDKDRWKR